MKTEKRAFEAEMKKIKKHLKFQRFFILALGITSVISIVLAYLFKVWGYDFISSLLQNIFCGLVTGMVVTVWSIWRENSEQKKRVLSMQLTNKIELLEINKLEFPTWTEDMDEQGIFSQKNVDRYVFYSLYLQKACGKISKLKAELFDVCEYFLLDEDCKAITQQLDILYKRICELRFDTFLYPDPYVEWNEEMGQYDFITSESPEYMEKTKDMEISYKSAVLAVWQSTKTELDENDYAELINLFNKVDAMIVTLNTQLEKLKLDGIKQIQLTNGK